MSNTKYVVRPTVTEDEEITRAALNDPDALPLSEHDMKSMKVVKPRGRPVGSGHKTQITLRLDDDVIDAFRSGGAGWQTRINDALKEWMRMHRNAT